MSDATKYGNMQSSKIELRSDIQACAKVLGTNERLPKLRRVLGKLGDCRSFVGVEEDDGGCTVSIEKRL